MLPWLLTLPDRLAASVSARPQLWRAAFAAILLMLLAATVVRYVKKVEQPSRDGTYTRSAFLRWQPQIDDLSAGVDIYQAYQYPNPPIMALILRPVMRLPSPADAVLWLLLKAGMAAAGFVWVFRLAADPGRRFPFPAWMLVVTLAMHPILGDLTHGNVNILIAFLVLASLELFRRRLDLLSGLVLALAIACKVTPALFVPYFGWKVLLGGWAAVRDRTSVAAAIWRSGGAVLAGCAVGLVVWLVAVPGAVFGFERNQQLLVSWFDQMVRPFVIDGKVTTEHANQSIPGLTFRLLTHGPSDLVYDDDGKPVPSEYHNLTDIGPAGARWVVRGFQAAFVAAVFFLARAPVARRRQGLRVAAELALVTLGMLLFSERTWKHHATTLMLPMAVLVGSWAMRPLGRLFRGYLLVTLTLCVLLMLVPSAVSGDFQDTCLAYGTHTAAFLLLTLGVVAVLGWESKFET